MYPKSKDFYPAKCECLLPVTRLDIPGKVLDVANHFGLVEKDEHHITVLAGANARDVLRFIDERQNKDELKNHLKSVFESKVWRYSLVPKFYLITKHYTLEELREAGYIEIPEHKKTTIIQRVASDDLPGFYEELKMLTQLGFELPLAHITLLGNSTYKPWKQRGIGVYSEQELASYLIEEITV